MVGSGGDGSRCDRCDGGDDVGGCSGDDQIIGTATISTSGGGIIPDAVVASPATTTASPSCTTTTTTTTSGCGGGSYTPPLNASVDTIGLENYLYFFHKVVPGHVENW